MATLPEGSSVEVQGSGSSRYVLERKGEVYSCTCPAWGKQKVRAEVRSCKHLVAYLGSAAEEARVGRAAMPRTVLGRAPGFAENPDVRAEREATLTRALSRFPAVRDKLMAVYGLRLPKHLAYAAGFFMALNHEESEEAWGHFGNGLAGVGEWFTDGALERQVIDGLDERLDMRYRRDPPEFVTICCGNSDGGHWGLWYDDPKELPNVVVHNYARDSAETSRCEPTLLATLYKDAEQQDGRDDPAEYPHRAAIFDWLKEVLPRELAAHREENIGRPPERTDWLVGSLDPYIAGWTLPADLAGYDAQGRRLAAYRARTPEVGQWIAQAFAELEQGSPGRALFLGNELHWFDGEEWQSECTELLVRAYTALGRAELAEIVRVHHRHRDLQSVGIYKQKEASPLLRAVGQRDLAAVKELLAAPTSANDRADALVAASSVELIELFLAQGTDGLDRALRQHLQLAVNSYLDEAARAAERALAMHLLLRAGIHGARFEQVLSTADPQLIAAAVAHADLAARDPKGLSVLHLAAQLGLPAIVRGLLERGADATAKDGANQTPYDHARHAWQHKPNEAAEIFTLLAAAGGGPPVTTPTAAAGPWAPGVAVRHPKFGTGVVEGVTGRLADTKLQIRFGSELKTLLAKFVQRW